jgi:hypothetical protein
VHGSGIVHDALFVFDSSIIMDDDTAAVGINYFPEPFSGEFRLRHISTTVDSILPRGVRT